MTYPQEGVVGATFQNGTSASGNLLIGTDGGGSAVRRQLLGPLAEPTSLPVHMVNLNARYRNPEHAVFIRERLRHFVDHGIHPKGMFFLMTLQSVPDPKDPTTWSFQITITWPPLLSPDQKNRDPPHTLKDLQELTKDWASPKREALQWLGDSEAMVTDGFFGKDGEHNTAAPETDPHQLVIPSDRVSVWVPVPWDNHNGRVTLAGDAGKTVANDGSTASRSYANSQVAHAMTFHRGQGLNNCIRDAKEFVDVVVEASSGRAELNEAIKAFEAEVIDRGTAEVNTSREQSLKCHNWETFQTSPIMKIGGNPIRKVESMAWKNLIEGTA